jgi:DNA-binding transcriptional LysR family regulator
MIDRYHLRYFLAIIDHGNFTRAADACNVAQPTLSVGIARLEKEVGAALFHRTNRRVELTVAGARLADHARQIEAQFNAAERMGANERPRRVFRLGILNTLPHTVIGRVATALRQWQWGRAEFIEGRERDLAERLATGRVEAALTCVSVTTERWKSVEFYSEGYALALPATHSLARASAIDAADLADTVMIVRRQCEVLPQTSQFFTKRGVRPFFAARTMNDERALAYVAAGLGITVMPDGFVAPGVVRVPLTGFNLVRTIGLVHRGDSELAEPLALVLSDALASG